jgi:hypothetical protein
MFRLIFPLLLAACVMPTPDQGPASHPDPQLKPNMTFIVEGKTCYGTCVQQRQSLVKISLLPPFKTYLLLFNTCGRQVEIWQPDPKKILTYDYSYAMEVESEEACPMLITAVTTDGEFHRGIIDFSNINHNPAIVDTECNGSWGATEGFAFCSIAAGLPVALTPREDAVIARDPGSDCPEPEQIPASRGWKIYTKKAEAGKPGLCVYVVKTKSKKYFRFTTQAYSSIMRVFPPEVKR